MLSCTSFPKSSDGQYAQAYLALSVAAAVLSTEWFACSAHLLQLITHSGKRALLNGLFSMALPSAVTATTPQQQQQKQRQQINRCGRRSGKRDVDTYPETSEKTAPLDISCYPDAASIVFCCNV